MMRLVVSNLFNVYFSIREYFELRLISVNGKPLQKCTEYRYKDILENGLSHQLYGLILTL